MKTEARNIFLELYDKFLRVERWNFLTNHAQVLLCLARDPGVRLREVAADLGITERSAHAIVADLAAAGYVVKHKHGRRNRYQIQAHLPLPDLASPESAIGDVLALLMGGRMAEGTAADTTTESGGISA
jgi:MarR family protein